MDELPYIKINCSGTRSQSMQVTWVHSVQCCFKPAKCSCFTLNSSQLTPPCLFIRNRFGPRGLGQISLLPGTGSRGLHWWWLFCFHFSIISALGRLSGGASPCEGDSRLLVPRRTEPSCLRCCPTLLRTAPAAARISALLCCTAPLFCHCPSSYSAVPMQLLICATL